MAWFIVSDVAGRLLGKLAQWNDEGLITHMGDTYFGGINKLEEFKETLKKIRTKYVHAERRTSVVISRESFLERFEGYVERRLSPWEEQDGAADFKAMVKKLKNQLYRVEELFDKIQIVETQRGNQQSSAGWGCKLIKSLCMSASRPSLLRANVKQISESMVQQVEAVMAMDWFSLKPHWSDNNSDSDEGDHVDDDGLSILSSFDQCVAYCSLFPKDYEINKTDLIHLWMAQGFLEPLNANNLTPLQLGHCCFDELAGNFFIKATRNQKGDVWKIKKDAQVYLRVARGECLLVDGEPDKSIDIKDLNHLSIVIGDSWEAPPWLLAAKHLRSLLLFARNPYSTPIIKNMGEVLTSLKCLRTLDLGSAYFENVRHTVDSIVWLKHLRHLNLNCPLKTIPASITVLHYLQTLDLRACHQLIKGLNNLNKNVTLLFRTIEYHNHLLVDESSSLNALIGSLQVLPELEIFFTKHRQGAVSEATAADLKSKLVDDLVLEWWSSYEVPDAQAKGNKEDMVLRKLKPPSSVKSLVVRFWSGTRFPSWEPSPSPYVDLPNLVSIEIMGCGRCRYVPSFSRLPSLRYLRLADLRALKYIEEIDIVDEGGSAAYFPSLETLKLEDLPEVMGWSKGIQQQDLCNLSQLEICFCPKLMSLPHTSTLDSICAVEIHRELLKHIPAISASPTNSKQLKSLQIDSVCQLSSLSLNPVPERFLTIKSCEDLVSIELSSESNGMLEIHNCSKLRHLSGRFRKEF